MDRKLNFPDAPVINVKCKGMAERARAKNLQRTFDFILSNRQLLEIIETLHTEAAIPPSAGLYANHAYRPARVVVYAKDNIAFFASKTVFQLNIAFGYPRATGGWATELKRSAS